MKGCIVTIFRLIIAVLVFFGLVHIGAVDFIKDKIYEYQNPPREKIINNAKDIADLSEIDEEYVIDKDLKLLKNRMIIAEHAASGQKIFMIEPQNDNFLTKADIENGLIQEKIETVLNKYKILKFDNVEITKRDLFEGINQQIPYVKITAHVSNIPRIKDAEGILGAAQLEGGKNLIIVSVNEKGKYSQIITEGFFKKVK